MLQRNKFGAVLSTFNIIQSKFSKLLYTTKTVNIGKSSASQRKKILPYAYELRSGSKTHRCKEHLLSALIRHNVSRLERETKIETYSHAFCGTFLPAVFILSARYKRRI